MEIDEKGELFASEADAATPGLGEAMRRGLRAGIPLAEILKLVFTLAAPLAIQAILDLIANLRPKGDLGEPVG